MIRQRALPPPAGWERLEGGTVLSVPGLTGAAVRAGLKESRDLDLALLAAREPLVAAGVFTRNRMPAAPVLLCRERLARHPAARCVVINAGNANAMTGSQGLLDARAMADRAEERCGAPALVLSTGIIGVPLPTDRVLDGIDAAATRLSSDAGLDLARAIMTTDTIPKHLALTHERRDGTRITVGGMAKGSGMIHPDLATMLSVVATDAPMTPRTARRVLAEAVDCSFHEITVDGDTSTNDTVLLLARQSDAPDAAGPDLQEGVTAVMRELAEDIVRDGEGASRIAHIRVTGAPSPAAARTVAHAVARSSLVKTALAGGDPNWGRILAAAASTEVPVTPEGLTLVLQGFPVFAAGRPLSVDPAALDQAFAREEVDIELGLGLGDACGQVMTTDLTHRYVEINSEYTT
jgi:glutamate N-acetyltransferase/amino-acid N-acetyltransferase